MWNKNKKLLNRTQTWLRKAPLPDADLYAWLHLFLTWQWPLCQTPPMQKDTFCISQQFQYQLQQCHYLISIQHIADSNFCSYGKKLKSTWSLSLNPTINLFAVRTIKIPACNDPFCINLCCLIVGVSVSCRQSFISVVLLSLYINRTLISMRLAD